MSNLFLLESLEEVVRDGVRLRDGREAHSKASDCSGEAWYKGEVHSTFKRAGSSKMCRDVDYMNYFWL